jgi:hypothetical protein
MLFCLFVQQCRQDLIHYTALPGLTVNRSDGQGRGFGVIKHYPGVCLVGQRTAGLRTEIRTHKLHTTVQLCHTLGRSNLCRLYCTAINMAYFWTPSKILGYPKQNALRTGSVCIIRSSDRGLHPAGPGDSDTFRVTCSPSSLKLCKRC